MIRLRAADHKQLVSWAGGFAAAAAAGLVMWLLRTTVQVRSIPERVLEWLLLFVPLELFESALQQFGFSAKVYALYLGILIMLALLTWVGAIRQSIGPAINVIVSGVAGWSSSDISATAASAATHG